LAGMAWHGMAGFPLLPPRHVWRRDQNLKRACLPLWLGCPEWLYLRVEAKDVLTGFHRPG
jgi:hypothetical protein